MKEEILIEVEKNCKANEDQSVQQAEKPENNVQLNEDDLAQKRAEDKAQNQENQNPKNNEYIFKVIFVQALVCFMLLGCMFLAKSSNSTMLSNLQLDFDNLMAYSISKEDFIASFSYIKNYFTGENSVWSVFNQSEQTDTQTTTSSNDDTTQSTTLDASTLGVGGDDLQVYEAQDSTSFAPFYTTQEILNPIENPIYSSHFGYRDNPFSGEFSFHGGIDIAAETGTNIRAAFSGTVLSVGEDDTSGLYVKLEHDDGLVTFYCHCSEILVEVGAKILQGETIAKVGETGAATGPHLHFEIRINDVKMNPMWLLA